jgi:hypothetical protein
VEFKCLRVVRGVSVGVSLRETLGNTHSTHALGTQHLQPCVVQGLRFRV